MDKATRRQVLAEWRGYREPPARYGKSGTVGDALPGLMKRLGLSERLQEKQVQMAWKDIVGEFLALHSSPESLKAGTLYVSVMQPAVRYELEQTFKSRIVSEMNRRFGRGTVKGIRFRLG